MTRHESRELAFILLFEKIFSDESTTMSDIIEQAKEYREIKVSSYAVTLACGVCDQQTSIDQIVSKHLNKWNIDRISKVSLSLLRLAVYEIQNESIDNSIIINEIVDLAKMYGAEDDSSFVNGVLGSIIRSGENK